MTAGFFFLHWLDADAPAVAYGQDDPVLDELLLEPGLLPEWQPITLRCAQVGPLLDYLPNNLSLRLCSDRLRDVLTAASNPADGLQWLDCRVQDSAGVEHAYSALRMTKHPDVLDERQTIWSRGWFVVKPVVNSSAAKNNKIFSFPGGNNRLVVSEDVRTRVLTSRLSGIDFAPVKVT